MKEKHYILLNSTLCYIMAFLATTFLHELAHAMVGKIFNSSPVLHHNFVVHFNSSNLSSAQQTSVNLAGPVFSLIQGLLAGWLFLKTQKRRVSELFLLWLSVLGLFNFMGYIFTAPFFKKGDISEVYSLLEIPVFQQVIISIIGAGGLLFFAYKMTQPFLSFSYEKKWVESGKDRQNFSLHSLLIPWIVGSSLVTVLYLPIIALISIFYPILSGFVFIYPWQNANRVKSLKLSHDVSIGSFSARLTLIFVAVVLFFKLVLAAGVEF